MSGSIYSPDRDLKKLFFVVDTSGSGTMTRGSGSGTLARNGTGDVTITFAKPFAVLWGVSIQAGSDSATNEYIGNQVIADTDATKVRVIVNDDAGTAANSTQVFVEVTGSYEPF